MSPTYFTPFISHLPLAHLVLMNPKFLNKKDADDEDLMRLKKLLKMISVSKSQWLKVEERKSLSQSTVTENPWASMAWYNETPVQSTPGKDLINLSPSVVHKKGSVGKIEKRTVFSRFWPAVHCGVGCEDCEVHSVKCPWENLVGIVSDVCCSPFYLSSPVSTLGHSDLHKGQRTSKFEESSLRNMQEG